MILRDLVFLSYELQCLAHARPYAVCVSKLRPCVRVVFFIVVEVGKVETTFIDIVRVGDPIPANLAQCIHNHYFKYHRLRSIPRVLGPLCVIQNFESVTSGRSKISEAAARNLASYFSAPHWYLQHSCYFLLALVRIWIPSTCKYIYAQKLVFPDKSRC